MTTSRKRRVTQYIPMPDGVVGWASWVGLLVGLVLAVPAALFAFASDLPERGTLLVVVGAVLTLAAIAGLYFNTGHHWRREPHPSDRGMRDEPTTGGRESRIAPQ